jgi:hypothetical protein
MAIDGESMTTQSSVQGHHPIHIIDGRLDASAPKIERRRKDKYFETLFS